MIPVATNDRDVLDSIAPAGSPASPVIPAEVVVTLAAPTFDSVSGAIKKSTAIPQILQGYLSFPSVPGSTPIYFPNPNFLQFATPLDSKSGSSYSQTRPDCTKFILIW